MNRDPAADRRATILVVLWAGAYLVARFFLTDLDAAWWARLLIALAPVPVFAAFLRTYLRAVRGMDELNRRIHFEAMAIAFCVGVLLLTTLAMMQHAALLAPDLWTFHEVFLFFPLSYLAAVRFIGRRYGFEGTTAE